MTNMITVNFYTVNTVNCGLRFWEKQKCKESKFAEINPYLSTTRWRIRFSKPKASITSFTSKTIRIFEIVFRCGNVSQKCATAMDETWNTWSKFCSVDETLCFKGADLYRTLFTYMQHGSIASWFSFFSFFLLRCLLVLRRVACLPLNCCACAEFRLFIGYAWCFAMLWLRVWNLMF